MSGSPEGQNNPPSDQAGKTRTWWHPLLVRILQHELSDAYDVREEVPVGKVPLRLDVVLIRRGEHQLSADATRRLAALVQRLNRFTLVEFKAPSDALEQGDFDHLLGCAHLFRAQQTERIPNTELSLILLAPTVTKALRGDVQASHGTLELEEEGIYRIHGPLFETWLIETDPRAGPGEPILTLFSRVFLKHRPQIMEQLSAAGHQGLLYYMLQQIEQFRATGEQFMIQHKDTEVMDDVDEDLRAAVLELFPPEQRLQGLSVEQLLQTFSAEQLLQTFSAEQLLQRLTAEQRLQGLSTHERLQGLSVEELVRHLGPHELERLRTLIDKTSPNG